MINKQTFNLFGAELFDLLLSKGGFTVDNDLIPYHGKGYAVATPHGETKIHLSALDLPSFINLLTSYSSKAYGGLMIGAWVADQTVYFDLTTIIEDRQEAISLGKALNQLAIYDFNNFNQITLK